MPEYHIPMGSFEDGRRWKDLDSFTQGYIEAAFFTNASSADDGDLEDATFAELAPAALAAIKQDCADFCEANRADLDEACDNGRIDGYDMERAGNDYWYSRNGHGTGFWDRGLGEVGDKLHQAARYSEKNLYRGDDGLIYLD